VNKKASAVKEQKFLVLLGLSFGNLLHFSRSGLASFEGRFSEEFEELLHVLVKTALVSFELFLHMTWSIRMDFTPHLHVAMPHVEKLADFPVLLPIFHLTSLGTIQGGLAYRAVQLRRCYGSAVDATPGHDCCWSGLMVL
jgi:hypothetical protein